MIQHKRGCTFNGSVGGMNACLVFSEIKTFSSHLIETIKKNVPQATTKNFSRGYRKQVQLLLYAILAEKPAPRADARAGTLESWQNSELFQQPTHTSVHKQKSGEVPWNTGERRPGTQLANLKNCSFLRLPFFMLTGDWSGVGNSESASHLLTLSPTSSARFVAWCLDKYLDHTG